MKKLLLAAVLVAGLVVVSGCTCEPKDKYECVPVQQMYQPACPPVTYAAPAPVYAAPAPVQAPVAAPAPVAVTNSTCPTPYPVAAAPYGYYRYYTR